MIVSLLVGDESGHVQVVDDFVDWYDESFLSLNVSLTKDMNIDFRKSSYSSSPAVVKAADIGIVESYKYLGVVLDHKLCFESHADATTKKVQQRLFLLRKMRSFNVSSEMLSLFYRSFIESVMSFGLVT